MLELGREARDKVTGFSGVMTGRSQWLTGCDQYCLAPKAKDGNEIKEGEWFDEGRLKIIGSGIHADEVKAEKKGGPQRDRPSAR